MLFNKLTNVRVTGYPGIIINIAYEVSENIVIELCTAAQLRLMSASGSGSYKVEADSFS